MTAATSTSHSFPHTFHLAPVAPRLDLYAGIHKALRFWMTTTLVRVGRLDSADPADRDEALADLESLLAVCESHIRHESEFIHTAIEARHPAGTARVADEHVEHAGSIAALRDEADALRAASENDSSRLALRLYRHLGLFVAENLQHMHVEETVHNVLLWQHYTDAELEALQVRLLASITPADNLATLRWMLPAVTPCERSMIVGGMATKMPPEALLGVLGFVQPHLDRAGWGKLAQICGIDAEVFA